MRHRLTTVANHPCASAIYDPGQLFAVRCAHGWQFFCVLWVNTFGWRSTPHAANCVMACDALVSAVVGCSVVMSGGLLFNEFPFGAHRLVGQRQVPGHKAETQANESLTMKVARSRFLFSCAAVSRRPGAVQQVS